MQLERDHERLRGALRLFERVLHRGRGRVRRGEVRVRDSEARRELPDVRGGEVQDLGVALNLCGRGKRVVRERSMDDETTEEGRKGER